ncbi:30S ribosomal protein S20 [bacterium]|nr:30S ribosomal protein S20 [bacterium]
MPITKSAKKRMLQNEKRRLRNASFKSKLRTHQRKLLRAIAEERKEDSQNLLRALASLYDKGVKKGIYKANTAARHKSRLAKKVNNLLGSGASAPQEGQAASQAG